MEIWFWLAVFSGVFSGISAFILKVAAKKDFNSEIFVLCSATISTLLIFPLALLLNGFGNLAWLPISLGIVGGVIAGLAGIFKVYALRFIDTTIYFPLFKLVSPIIAIVFGLLLFSENFTSLEWLGLAVSLLVPLLLVNKQENHIQKNLLAGILLVLLTGVMAASVAVISKHLVNIYDSIWWIVLSSSVGVFIGSVAMIFFKNGIKRLDFSDLDRNFLAWAFMRSTTITTAFVLGLYSFFYAGTLGIVYSIQSLYIVIPIALAVLFYQEHWNFRKVSAVVLSLVALALLG